MLNYTWYRVSGAVTFSRRLAWITLKSPL